MILTPGSPAQPSCGSAWHAVLLGELQADFTGTPSSFLTAVVKWMSTRLTPGEFWISFVCKEANINYCVYAAFKELLMRNHLLFKISIHNNAVTSLSCISFNILFIQEMRASQRFEVLAPILIQLLSTMEKP